MLFFSRSATFFIVIVLAFSCSKSSVKFFNKKQIKSLEITDELIRDQDFLIIYPGKDKKDSLTLKYLGSGGYYIGNVQAGLLVDPFFSPTKVFSLTLKKIYTQQENVEKGLGNIKTEIYSNTETIFNSHSHYDHLMDVPYVYNRYFDTLKTQNRIYGSTSMKSLLSTVVNPNVVVSIEAQRGTIDTPGDWVYLNNNKIRVLPIKTVHAPHYKKGLEVSLYAGEAKPIEKYQHDTDKTRVTDWREGQSFAYLIDFLNEDEISFRIYILTSASSPPDGFIHSDILSEHSVNLAILGAASFENVEDYPEGIINLLQPEKVLIAHWEDLFKPYLHDPPRLIRASDFKKLIPRINKVFPWKMDDQQQLFMPVPGTFIELVY